MKVWAPGKLNLCFDVLYRREDGYHAVDGIMHTIELADTLEFKRSRRLSLEIRRADDDGASPGDGGISLADYGTNLVMAAARRLKELTGYPGGASIRLTKAIPVAAGLGGGSADAGACLTALNELWGLGLTGTELHRIALSLGADVPFFLQGGAARARGIGEDLTPLPPLSGAAVVLIPQPFPVSTAAMFQAFSAASFPSPGKEMAEGRPGTAGAAPRPAVPVSAMAAAINKGSLHEAAPLCANRLEDFAASLYPPIGEAVGDLKACGALGAAMTGTGPTVFGLFASGKHAADALARLKVRWPLALQTVLSPGRPQGKDRGDDDYGNGPPGKGRMELSTGGGAAPQCQRQRESF